MNQPVKLWISPQRREILFALLAQILPQTVALLNYHQL